MPGATDGTWRPEAPATAVAPAPVPKGDLGAAQRRRGFLFGLAFQGFLALVLVAAAVFARNQPTVSLVYAWTIVVPAGYATVFTRAYRRGEQARARGTWRAEDERRAARRSFSVLGLILAVWGVGAALLFVLA